MKRQTRLWIAAALMLAAAGAASAGTVNVTYKDPDKFIDVPFWDQDRTEVLKEFSEHFARLGKQLPANQQLNITVTEIDLAGRVEPRRNSMRDLRVLRGGADWPTMQLNYSLEQDGKVIASGNSSLNNMMYLQGINPYREGDLLRYEKPMVDKWFKETFTAPAQLSKK
ncbi:DUF3016 domain-containing protein [Pseudoduganella sp.]|uniref:DUF3016 domain-containing protein n=1 Tax=Pseudoduganella sp. TaxID=1880898 RepID=UPI0035AD8905